MKKILFCLSLVGVFLLSADPSFSWPRLGSGANIVTQNSGDRATGISVIVSSSAATQVTSAVSKNREILLQNTSENYVLHCGTFSTVTAALGVKRFILPKFPVSFTTNATMSLWCIGEVGAPDIEVVGEYEYDYRD